MQKASLFAAATSLTLAFTPGFAETTAFVNVNVLPMDENEVLAAHTVIVEGDLIEAVGQTAQLSVPDDARVIEGTDAWLMPGLADMHMHLHADPSPDFMRLWLAEGVTTVRNLNTTPPETVWSEEVLAGSRIGPTVYNTGPVIVGIPPDLQSLKWQFRAGLVLVPAVLFSLAMAIVWLLRRFAGRRGGLRRVTIGGSAVALVVGAGLALTRAIPIDAFTSFQFPFADTVETEAEARAWVRRQAEDGYRMVKIYEFMGGETWLAVQDEAEKAGLYSISHFEPEAGLSDSVVSGVDEIAHVDELLDLFFTEPISPHAFRPVPMAPERLPDVIRTVADRDLMVVSNMVADENVYLYLEEGPSYFDRPEYATLRPETKERWRHGRVVRWQGQQETRRNDWQPIFASLVKGLHDAGTPILTGTDVSVDGIMPWHIHREIELLVEAGLGRFEALRAATYNAGASIARAGFEDRFGTVAPGSRADLILLRENPLTNKGATRDRIGVMARGTWYPQAELDALVAEVVAGY